MSIWKEQGVARKEAPPLPADPAGKKDVEPRVEPSSSYELPRRVAEREMKESLIGADLTIEGKIEGSGHVRLAGRFKGDVHVKGNVSIDAGAKLTGGVSASTVVIGGELEGNIDAASRVELLETGVLNGDLKAGSLIVAAGSRMRGHVKFGWEEKTPVKSAVRMELGSTA
jgi:cytoskeletal protein CcmA (bactofilin family)